MFWIDKTSTFVMMLMSLTKEYDYQPEERIHVFGSDLLKGSSFQHDDVGYDVSERHPKLAALANRTKADPAVAEYLSHSEIF